MEISVSAVMPSILIILGVYLIMKRRIQKYVLHTLLTLYSKISSSFSRLHHIEQHITVKSVRRFIYETTDEIPRR